MRVNVYVALHPWALCVCAAPAWHRGLRCPTGAGFASPIVDTVPQYSGGRGTSLGLAAAALDLRPAAAALDLRPAATALDVRPVTAALRVLPAEAGLALRLVALDSGDSL